MLGLWDGNPVKSDCYDHYITTDVIKNKIKCNSEKKNKKIKNKKIAF